MLLEEYVDKGPGLGWTSPELDNNIPSHVANTTKEKRNIKLKIKSRFACDDFPGISLLQFLCQYRLYDKDSLSCNCINIEKVYSLLAFSNYDIDFSDIYRTFCILS